MATSQLRTNVYVDGFNLYYGAMKGTPHKWCDLGTLFAFLLPGNHIQRIRYFTALTQPRPSNPTEASANVIEFAKIMGNC